ncbi:MAG: glycosyltransferase family 2 protein [Fusobacteriaceae bacterium]
MGLSVSIITFNEEKNIGRTLESIKNIADEIIIIDSGSTDKTKEIALSYGAKFYNQKWLGYGGQKNLAIEKSTNEWILNIDADEEISLELNKKIKEIISEEKSSFDVYDIKFASVCFGKELKHGGWSESYHTKLFKKESGKYNLNMVHEKFETSRQIGKIKEKFLHHSYLNLEDYFSKFNRYTTEGALEYYKKNKKTSVIQIVLNPLYKFIKMYIIRLGFLDGIEGFLIAVTSSLYTMVKYFKLREIYRNAEYIDKK